MIRQFTRSQDLNSDPIHVCLDFINIKLIIIIIIIIKLIINYYRLHINIYDLTRK